MAQYKVFRLHFRTPLHIGLGRSTYDSSSSDLHSDTISAALAAIKAQHGASSEELRCFLDSFAMSSAFPYEGKMYFLPRPLTADRITVDGNDGAEFRKLLKSVRYIESSVWKDFVEESVPSISSLQIHDEYLTPVCCKDFEIPFKKQVMQRVSVSRSEDNAASPFFFEWCFFNNAKDCGLYVIADATDEVLAEIESLLKELGETGLGTDKSVGGGQFDVTIDSIDLPSKVGDSWLSLSLYLPTLEEQAAISIKASCYNFSLRGGFMAGSTNNKLRHLWKKSVYMYVEGSVFAKAEKPEGCIVDLRPEWNSSDMHPVYRSGKALFIPIKAVKQ
jgi:CRISPR type III-A-associated RAMP protein Csm4